MRRSILPLLASVVLVASCRPPSAHAAEAPGVAASAPDAAASATPFASLDILYVDSDLRTPGLASPGPDADLVDWNVPAIGRLMRERGPLVLAANGLSGDVTVQGAVPDGPATGLRPVLLLQIAEFGKSAPRLFAKAGSVVFDARLVDRDAAGKPRWQGRLSGALGFDPVLGALKTNRVDTQWVDGILVLALDRLAQQGLVKLSGPKALRPRG